MLLYINDTWRYLEKHSEVQDALRNGTATKSELLAAGYNSNPMRLPTYLKNGGAGWRSLIPAETQMYLAIYGSVDTAVKFDQSYAEKAVAAPAATQPAAAVNKSGRVASRATSWLGGKLLMSESLFSFLTIVS